jgi:hypothetical protein
MSEHCHSQVYVHHLPVLFHVLLLMRCTPGQYMDSNQRMFGRSFSPRWFTNGHRDHLRDRHVLGQRLQLALLLFHYDREKRARRSDELYGREHRTEVYLLPEWQSVPVRLQVCEKNMSSSDTC